MQTLLRQKAKQLIGEEMTVEPCGPPWGNAKYSIWSMVENHHLSCSDLNARKGNSRVGQASSTQTVPGNYAGSAARLCSRLGSIARKVSVLVSRSSDRIRGDTPQRRRAPFFWLSVPYAYTIT